MKFSILTLFPEVITAYCQSSIIGKAQQSGAIEVRVVNPRDYTTDPHKKVDDSPYGGGSGMVLRVQPMDDAFASLTPLAPRHRVLLTSPAGRVFDHAMAQELKDTTDELVIFCGHYEGFDERIKDIIPEIEEVSIGDYVLTGGELPALVMMDAVSRLVPGVVQKFSSVEADSFYSGLLDCPHYTRPETYKGVSVPEVLLSGNHKAIADWRHTQALQKTKTVRPDLLMPDATHL